MTQAALAERAAIAQGFLSEIEGYELAAIITGGGLIIVGIGLATVSGARTAQPDVGSRESATAVRDL